MSDKTLENFGIKYVKHRQVPGELVVTYPSSIHQVINKGIMINESINYCPKALMGEFRWRGVAKIQEDDLRTEKEVELVKDKKGKQTEVELKLCYNCLKDRCLGLSMLQQLNPNDSVPGAEDVASAIVMLHPNWLDKKK